VKPDRITYTKPTVAKERPVWLPSHEAQLDARHGRQDRSGRQLPIERVVVVLMASRARTATCTLPR
jgi:hypothetical protein